MENRVKVKVGLRIPLQQAPPEPKRRTRDAFVYMDPHAPKNKFAQCETCIQWTGPTKNRCAILGKALEADADDACNLYVHGKPDPTQEVVERVTPEEAGFVDRQVRCENCVSFNPDTRTCGLYQMLNDKCGDKFDLDEQVDRYGCCNANKPKKGVSNG